ncbi:hypothetical protein PF005_g7078 [Phytophthora fragariae]|uniref:Uncharacterized protein n=1 Tax=Phytophthora fragariae TaxID=53985 RepID=A0A6A3F409_9STRA|nr:hypothetical protein PF003_g13877 [Phytophthora fragariae]KAE8939943.1 hypothetical protein PF009_g10240 [Phytophthora fragariae]KAE9005857.1 hypothetical protein PF011_g11857 [Phytophthora fragariae]KAE9076058.1 hypothetical protein PF010_g24053 [Phytophthora fragariae]KAE9221493.1 hypothetical protein PF005_g7078 [Phytophthora fragariae]
MPSSLELLPPPLLSYVLEFAILKFTRDLEMRWNELPLDDLKKVALVSKTLLATVRDFVKGFQADTMELSLQNVATPAQVAAEILIVAGKGSAICDFRVYLGDFDNGLFTAEVPRLGRLEQVEIDWARIFGFMPRLRRLDLVSPC